MAQDKKKALDDKTKKLWGKRIEEGKEHSAYQEAQQQLLAIQAEQQQNLAVARAESKASFENNQTLAQAAELGAISAAEAEQMAQAEGQQVNLNPATQQILNKYGAGQPRFQRSQSHSQQVTKQNITINNNITSNTTNDVKVPGGIGGPIQGRPLQFKSPGQQDSTGKFKAWISSAFARQNEEGARRDREYRQRESSLTRSASRMMKKLEDVGKTIGTRMDPRKIGSTWQSQLKTLLLLFGFGYLTSNWTKVLDKVSSIEEWVRNTWNYFDSGEFSEQFSSKLTYYLGGNEGESPLEAFTKLLKEIFTDDSPGSLLGGIKGFFTDMWDNRAKAVESIKFPEIDITNITSAIQSIGQYLGDLLSAIFGGKSSLNNRINNRVVAEVAQKVIDKNYTTGADAITKQTLSLKNASGEEFKGDQGVLSIFYGNRKGLTRYSINDDGSLNENEFAEATVGSASDIVRIKDEMKNGNLNEGEAASMTLHLNNLYKAAEKSKSKTGEGIPVDASFLKSIFTKEELDKLQRSKDIKKSHYDVVLKEKTKEDWGREGLDANANALKVGLSSAAISEISKLLGHDWAGKLTNLFQNGGLSAINPLLGATAEKYGTELRKFFENSKRFTIVKNASVNDPGYTGIKQLVYEVSPHVIEKVAAKLATGDFNSNVNVNNRSELQKLIYGHARGTRIEDLNNQIDQYNSETSSYKSYLPWNAPKTAYHQVKKQFIKNELEDLYKAGKDETGFANLEEPEEQEENENVSEHRFQKAVERGKDLIYNMSDGYWGTHTETITAGKSIDNNDLKIRKQYLFKLLRSKGLSDGAIAGIIGNLENEGLNRLDTAQHIPDPTKKNPKAYSIGIAQFNSEGELPNLQAWAKKKGLNYKTFEAQAQYIADHSVIDKILKETHGLSPQEALKKSAIIWGHDFERFQGNDAADNHGNLIGRGKNPIKVPVKSGNKYREDGLLYGDENYAERIQSGLNTYNTYSGSDLSDIVIQSSRKFKQEDEEKKSEPKSFLEIFKETVTKFIMNLGGIFNTVTDKVGDAVSPITDEIKKTVLAKGYHYDEPITKEFTDYDTYLANQENLPKDLPAGLSYVDWKNRVYDMTGSMPQNLDITTESRLREDNEEKLRKYSKVDEETSANLEEAREISSNVSSPNIDIAESSFKDIWKTTFNSQTYESKENVLQDLLAKVSNIEILVEQNLGANTANGVIMAHNVDATNNGARTSANAVMDLARHININQKNQTGVSQSLMNGRDSSINKQLG